MPLGIPQQLSPVSRASTPTPPPSYTTKQSSPGYAPYGVAPTTPYPSWTPPAGPAAPQSGMGREGNYGNVPSTGPAISPYAPYGQSPYAPQNPLQDRWTLNPQQQLGIGYGNQLSAINQQGLANTQYNSAMGLLNQNQYSDKVNFANQGAALDSQQLGVGQYQDVTLAGQRAQTAFDTAQANYQTTMGQINAQAGLTDAQRAEKIRAARVAHADILAKLQANYGLDVNDLNLAAGKDTRSNRSSATARGAVGSSGFQTTNNDIANQLASGMNRENSNLQLGTTGANNDFTASNNATDLAYRQNQLQLQAGRDQAAADAKKAADDKAASDKYLASVADQYGIRQDQADLALQSGLSNLGYDAAATTAALAQAQASNNATIAAQAAALTASAIQAGIGASSSPHPPAAKPPPKPAPKPATGPHVIQS